MFISGFVSYLIDYYYRQKPWLIPGMTYLWHKHKYTVHCPGCKNMMNTGEFGDKLNCSCGRTGNLRYNGIPITYEDARKKVIEYLKKNAKK
jgi:hypothetical protein